MIERAVPKVLKATASAEEAENEVSSNISCCPDRSAKVARRCWLGVDEIEDIPDAAAGDVEPAETCFQDQV